MKYAMKSRAASGALVWLLCAVVLPLSGCGWLIGEDGLMRDRKNDYLKAAVTPPLTLPAGMQAPGIEDLYVIPQSTDAARPREFEVPRPSPLMADLAEQKVRIQRLGQEQWILVAVPPSQLWTQIREFLLLRRIGIVSEAGQQGNIESALFTVEGSEGPERFRFHVEQGVQRNMSEVHVVHAAAAPFQAASVSRAREDWMVNELAEYLAGSIDRAAYSLVAQGINTNTRLELQRPQQGAPYLKLMLPRERAFASIAYALKRSPLKAEDVDRAGGLFYARYLPPPREEDKPNWFMALFVDDPEYADVEYGGNRYRITVTEAAGGVEIRVLELQGSEREDDFNDIEAEYMLNVLKGYLT